jgi:N-methylhydantoinase B
MTSHGDGLVSGVSSKPAKEEDFDAITLEILWNRLIAITDEAAAALVRTSFSTLLRENNDYACVLMDTEGNAIAENHNSIPSFVGCLSITLRHFLKRFPLESWQPGDVVITNDPWLATGHRPDATIVMPIFFRDWLVGFAGNIAHWPDIGGGVWSADSREVFEEGLGLPPLKLYKAGEANEDIFSIIRSNVRVPEQVLGDLQAQITAAQVCINGVIEFLEEQHLRDLSSLSAAVQGRAEEAMRQAIRAIPNGVYQHQIEADGFDHPLTLAVTVTIHDDEVNVDYTGTSSQIPHGALNCVMNYTWAYTVYPLKCVIDPHTKKNEGSYRPFNVTAPVGSLLNPTFPAAVNARQLTGHMLSGLIFGALAEVLPDQIMAESGSAPTFRTLYAGQNADGAKFSFILFANGGMGARPTSDGLACTPFPTNSTCASIEVMEGLAPLRVWSKRIRIDSGGAGKYRGGLGQEIQVEVINDKPILLSILSDRHRHPAQGVLGGMPGAPTEALLNGEHSLHPKSRATLNPGDLLTLRYAGGGGYGDPRKRAPELIAKDLQNGVISATSARDSYFFAVDDTGYDEFSKIGPQE